MKARVTVMPKQAVLAPKESPCAMRSIISASRRPRTCASVKFLEIEVAGSDDRAALEQKLHALCRDLLSNPVIEDYQLELSE